MNTVLYFLFTTVWTALVFPFAVVETVLKRRADGRLLAVRFWAQILMRVGGIDLRIEGMENISPLMPTIFVSNHQSTLDIPLMFLVLPVNLRFLAKHTLKYVPFVGWFMSATGFIFINRKNRNKAVKSLQQAGEKVRSGVHLLVFAEGTRSATGALLPFKKGAFILAFNEKIPVCPITVEGSHSVMPKNSWRICRGAVVQVKVGRPLMPKNFPATHDDLISQMHQEVTSMHKDLLQQRRNAETSGASSRVLGGKRPEALPT